MKKGEPNHRTYKKIERNCVMESEKPPVFTGYNSGLKDRARTLRKNMTKQECHLWYDFLKYRPEHWNRQRVIDCYITDFFCYSAGLVIELDGAQHYTEEGEEYDSIRTEILERYQLEVIRFLNSEIDRHFDSVCLAIDEKVRERKAFFEKMQSGEI